MQKTAAQRLYATNSILQSGNFIKIGITRAGVYKIDVAFLNNTGLSSGNISSSSIRLFGNGGQMLEEKNTSNYNDDLIENAIEVIDGGDGIFNNSDYFLFYAPGPNKWIADSINQTFTHQKNIYSDTAYYFITLGSNGKRIITKTITAIPTQTVTAYNDHYFYENDLVNFLNSGKEWYGEEFSNITNILSRNFTVDLNGLIQSEPLTITTNFAGRSVNSASTLILKANNTALNTITIPTNSGNFLDVFAASVSSTNNFTSSLPSLDINVGFTPANASAQAWLNWFEVHSRRAIIIPSSGQLLFRDWRSVGTNNIAAFTISNSTSSTSVWDVSNSNQPEKMATSYVTNQTTFINNASRLKEYIAFNNANYLTPVALGKIENQNLHNSNVVDYLIVTNPLLLNEAKRLALFHTQQNGYKVFVATTTQIFNEFASGNLDPTAIRDFVKMYYDKAGADSTKRPKYLLLFGNASFDYKNRIANNSNLVPCYESNNALDPLSTYTSDDFFGLLDNSDDINNTAPVSLLDIGIGRIPAINATEAKIMVDKVINYYSKQSLGAWRNTATFVADDKDNNTHLNDAESISSNVTSTDANINQNKVYLDAYSIASSSSGARYPEVNTALVNQLYNGTLLFNYTGHGGYQRLADEAIFDQDVLNKVSNPNKLPLFITATCDFAPYDDPTKTSIGGQLLTQSNNGAIALMTTTRIVFAFSNKIINTNYLNIALQADVATGKYLSLGEAVKRAKNYTYQTFADIINNRKFTLLGDPAMRLAFPENKVQLTSINNNAFSGNDTLKALNKYSFGGLITDATGNVLSNFNGTVNAIIFDKPQTITTKGNDPSSPVTSFSQQTNFLYKGKASVVNGNFSFSCIIPKDINYQIGKGKISLYADDGNSKDATGYNSNFFIGGSSNSTFSDKDGPTIKAYLNDDKFVNGGLSNENPILILKLNDSSGINTVGTGIGHDITAILDGDEKNIIKLNDYYEAALNNFQEGQIRYQFSTLSEGLHNLKIKAWDVFNNSTEIIIEFTVVKKQQLQINHVYNYPNPFTSKTTFWFEHNQPGENLNVLINIFSVSGKLVHQIKRTINTSGNRSAEIEWDGKDNFSSEKIGRGVYIYRIIVTSNNGKAETTQKLYLL